MVELTDKEYQEWLANALLKAMVDEGYDPAQYQINIYQERDFEKSLGEYVMQPDDITIVFSYGQGELEYNVLTRPISIYILSEQNSFEVAFNVAKRFADNNNFLIQSNEENDTIQHNYDQPTINEPFELEGVGFRASLSISGSLVISQKLANLETLEYIARDGTTLVLYDKANGINKILSFQYNYGASYETQVYSDEQIAVSQNTSAVLTMTISIPPERTALLKDVLEQTNGSQSSDSGYAFKWTFYGVEYDFTIRKLKLTTFSSTTTADNSPTLAMGFQA